MGTRSFFQVRSPLCAHFFTKDRYRSCAHFADFQVCSSLNRSKKTAVGSWKRALKRKIATKTTAVLSLKIRALTPPPPHLAAFFSDSSSTHNLKYVQIVHFSTILTALFCPYIAHERTSQNLILSVRSLRFALCLKERHRSQNEGSLKSEERFQRAMCPALIYIYKFKILGRSAHLLTIAASSS